MDRLSSYYIRCKQVKVHFLYLVVFVMLRLKSFFKLLIPMKNMNLSFLFKHIATIFHHLLFFIGLQYCLNFTIFLLNFEPQL